jgi:hypothetical protein
MLGGILCANFGDRTLASFLANLHIKGVAFCKLNSH